MSPSLGGAACICFWLGFALPRISPSTPVYPFLDFCLCAFHFWCSALGHSHIYPQVTIVTHVLTPPPPPPPPTFTIHLLMRFREVGRGVGLPKLIHSGVGVMHLFCSEYWVCVLPWIFTKKKKRHVSQLSAVKSCCVQFHVTKVPVLGFNNRAQ